VTPQAIVLYDDDCGFCRWTLGLLLRWDRGHRLWPAPIAGPCGDRWLAGMPVAERLASWHLVRDGRVVSAGRALPEVLEYLPGGGVLARAVRRAPGVVERGYAFVVRHRSGLARPVPGAWVRAASARVEARSREAPPAWANVNGAG
jgi:predicted DCC family thiol-disulfide oxidoreductase YuxK